MEQLVADGFDIAEEFRGFWKHDPEVPDELRRDLSRYGHIMLPEPTRSEYERELAELLEARRTWLREKGYR